MGLLTVVFAVVRPPAPQEAEVRYSLVYFTRRGSRPDPNFDPSPVLPLSRQQPKTRNASTQSRVPSLLEGKETPLFSAPKAKNGLRRRIGLR
jgi:hypothetical protein